MAGVDEKFSSDIDRCLDIARRLSKLETEESHRFVSEQLRILNDFLQKKQKDAEARVDEEIAEEQREIESLKSRIEKASSDTETDHVETDIDLTDYRGMWNTLHERYWQKAFDVYISETKDDVKTILDNLIKILKTSHDVCKQKAISSRDEIVLQILQPGEERTTHAQTKGADPSLINVSTNCQRACIPFCLSSVQEVIAVEIKLHKDVKRYFVYQHKDILTALDKYLEKCVEFCWVACFQEPEIQIVTTPNKECKKIALQFQGLDKTTHAARKFHVEWPALVQGENVTVHWQLYDLSAGRPAPKTKQSESSQQYRASYTEDASGEELEDTEEVTKTAKSAIESNMSANSRKPPSGAGSSGYGSSKTNTNQTKASQKKQAKIPPTKPKGGNNKGQAVRKSEGNNLNRRKEQYEATKTRPKNPNLDF